LSSMMFLLLNLLSVESTWRQLKPSRLLNKRPKELNSSLNRQRILKKVLLSRLWERPSLLNWLERQLWLILVRKIYLSLHFFISYNYGGFRNFKGKRLFYGVWLAKISCQKDWT
jgi:hypothetical protein